MVKISVIVPVYNTEKYLPKCLDSLIAQTLKDIEIICINDCSTDNSLEILKKYAEKDNRIKIIDLPQNKGAAYARNQGIDLAQGDYLGFVDSDDFIDLDFYEKLYTKAIETNADAVKGKLWLYNIQEKKKYIEDWIDINDDIKHHPAYFYFTFTTAIYNTRFIKKNNIHFLENLIHFEDPYFTIKAAIFYKKLILDDTACYYYTNNPSSSSRNITLQHAKDISKGTNFTLDMLNKSKVSTVHYAIVFNFLLNQMLNWCYKTNCMDIINKESSIGFSSLLKKCKELEFCMEFYFINKKSYFKKNILKKLRRNLKNA